MSDNEGLSKNEYFISNSTGERRKVLSDAELDIIDPSERESYLQDYSDSMRAQRIARMKAESETVAARQASDSDAPAQDHDESEEERSVSRRPRSRRLGGAPPVEEAFEELNFDDMEGDIDADEFSEDSSDDEPAPRKRKTSKKPSARRHADSDEESEAQSTDGEDDDDEKEEEEPAPTRRKHSRRKAVADSEEEEEEEQPTIDSDDEEEVEIAASKKRRARHSHPTDDDEDEGESRHSSKKHKKSSKKDKKDKRDKKQKKHKKRRHVSESDDNGEDDGEEVTKKHRSKKRSRRQSNQEDLGSLQPVEMSASMYDGSRIVASDSDGEEISNIDPASFAKPKNKFGRTAAAASSALPIDGSSFPSRRSSQAPRNAIQAKLKADPRNINTDVSLEPNTFIKAFLTARFSFSPSDEILPNPVYLNALRQAFFTRTDCVNLSRQQLPSLRQAPAKVDVAAVLQPAPFPAPLQERFDQQDRKSAEALVRETKRSSLPLSFDAALQLVWFRQIQTYRRNKHEVAVSLEGAVAEVDATVSMAVFGPQSLFALTAVPEDDSAHSAEDALSQVYSVAPVDHHMSQFPHQHQPPAHLGQQQQQQQHVPPQQLNNYPHQYQQPPPPMQQQQQQQQPFYPQYPGPAPHQSFNNSFPPQQQQPPQHHQQQQQQMPPNYHRQNAPPGPQQHQQPPPQHMYPPQQQHMPLQHQQQLQQLPPQQQQLPPQQGPPRPMVAPGAPGARRFPAPQYPQSTQPPQQQQQQPQQQQRAPNRDYPSTNNQQPYPPPAVMPAFVDHQQQGPVPQRSSLAVVQPAASLAGALPPSVQSLLHLQLRRSHIYKFFDRSWFPLWTIGRYVMCSAGDFGMTCCKVIDFIFHPEKPYSMTFPVSQDIIQARATSSKRAVDNTHTVEKPVTLYLVVTPGIYNTRLEIPLHAISRSSPMDYSQLRTYATRAASAVAKGNAINAWLLSPEGQQYRQSGSFNAADDSSDDEQDMVKTNDDQKDLYEDTNPVPAPKKQKMITLRLLTIPTPNPTTTSQSPPPAISDTNSVPLPSEEEPVVDPFTVEPTFVDQLVPLASIPRSFVFHHNLAALPDHDMVTSLSRISYLLEEEKIPSINSRPALIQQWATILKRQHGQPELENSVIEIENLKHRILNYHSGVLNKDEVLAHNLNSVETRKNYCQEQEELLSARLKALISIEHQKQEKRMARLTSETFTATGLHNRRAREINKQRFLDFKLEKDITPSVVDLVYHERPRDILDEHNTSLDDNDDNRKIVSTVTRSIYRATAGEALRRYTNDQPFTTSSEDLPAQSDARQHAQVLAKLPQRLFLGHFFSRLPTSSAMSDVSNADNISSIVQSIVPQFSAPQPEQTPFVRFLQGDAPRNFSNVSRVTQSTAETDSQVITGNQYLRNVGL